MMSISGDGAYVMRMLSGRYFVGCFGFACIMFAAAHGHLPLYYGNQNTYLLHGLAMAEVGGLSRDWLANTRDAFPVFSGLVFVTLKVLPEWSFYVYHFMLKAIFVASMAFIVRSTIFLQRINRSANFQTLIFILIATVACGRMMSALSGELIGDDIRTLYLVGLAGQFVLGDVLQPSAFGVFLVAAIAFYLYERRNLALVCIAIACYVHPTYLLPGAMLTLSFAWLDLVSARNIRRAIITLALAGFLVLPQVLYSMIAFLGSDAEVSRQAHEILVVERNPHHAIVSEWISGRSVLPHFCIIATALWVTRRTRLFPVLAIGFSISLILSILQYCTGSYFLALLFPWRMSVVLVPVSAFVILAALMNAPFIIKILRNARRQVSAVGLLVVLSTVSVGFGVFDSVSERRARVKSENVFFQQVERHVDIGARVLVPLDLERFRLATKRAIFVDWKSAPVLADEVVEWHRRTESVRFLYSDAAGCDDVIGFMRRNRISHAVDSAGGKLDHCDNLVPVVITASFNLLAPKDPI